MKTNKKKYSVENKKKSIDDIMKKLEEGMKATFEGDNFKNWLNMCSKFHSYSFNNTILIAMQGSQMPNFQGIVAGYHSWQNDFHRQVLKGEKGIRILAPAPYKQKMEQDAKDMTTGEIKLDEFGNPMKETVEVKRMAFRPVSVWDVSQTEGEPLPELGIQELKYSVENYEHYQEALLKIAPVPVSFEAIEGSAKGYFSPSKQMIVVKEGMPELQTLKTLIHEIAHSLKDDAEHVRVEGMEERKHVSRSSKEVEAEASAYVVCQHFGIGDTADYSFGYIASWAAGREMEELKGCMETIKQVSGKMISGMEQELKALQVDKKLDKASTREKLQEKKKIVEERKSEMPKPAVNAAKKEAEIA